MKSIIKNYIVTYNDVIQYWISIARSRLDFRGANPEKQALEKLSNADRKASLKRCEAKASASLFLTTPSCP